MPRYELIEGKASKFWKIERSGKSFTTTYGRIGSSGQTTTKKFGSEAETSKQYDKLVGEKVGKGYKLVGEQAAVQPQHLGQVYGDTAVLLALLLDGGAAGRWRGVEGGEYDAVLPVIRNRDAAPYTVASQRGWLLAVGNSILDVFKRADDEVVLVGMLGEDDEDDEREAEFVAQAARLRFTCCDDGARARTPGATTTRCSPRARHAHAEGIAPQPPGGRRRCAAAVELTGRRRSMLRPASRPRSYSAVRASDDPARVDARG